MSKTKTDMTLTLVPETEPRPNVLVVRLGRGRTGGSTALDWIIQRARSQGRDVLIGDGDMRIPTKPAMHSNLKPATYSDAKPAGVPI